ncbi:MAG TPA: EspA/EspE family type VII secretion system effector [Mycobacterium sp.]|nr:EspA/EspE family type VII secretion system effector [Mycobacterium sp.]
MSLLGEALDLLRRYGDVVGIDWSKPPGLLDKAANTLIDIAGSPILGGAQAVIHGMKATTGSGEPEAGEAFKKSADLYDEAGSLLIDAAVKPDRWDGTAAQAYEAKNDAHRRLTIGVADAEKNMQSYLSELAAQVTETRTNLDDRIKFLSDYDTATSWMNAIPGGAVVKAAADLAVASTQLEMAKFSMAKLLAESALNANRIRDQLATYGDAAGEALFADDKNLPCGEPFGDERTQGQLPQRINPTQPYEIPEPQGPPVIYPPAKPADTPAPR